MEGVKLHKISRKPLGPSQTLQVTVFFPLSFSLISPITIYDFLNSIYTSPPKPKDTKPTCTFVVVETVLPFFYSSYLSPQWKPKWLCHGSKGLFYDNATNGPSRISWPMLLLSHRRMLEGFFLLLLPLTCLSFLWHYPSSHMQHRHHKPNGVPKTMMTTTS